ncbi:phosphate:acyl-[acyl carrier protein] acyltransferase [Candidatus Ruthia magnifica str. Cm (Calyptogena magnifica)]|uniref:Phosphate acyltransferase n=1 Tax=Ruthia magnifica subsp. Calyptogena magnifica TaxID=413404 RepID=PLSX_RUTMC|nr:phosphate acyltransferase PlsX [Candidatus Ruthturnera calyptogenae]A1AWD3.1 RecName: Full=Phosphate acyltransferase; AltName: Full=Acyl-ACP phosphotransacylase; AltName: Full=Acyl-[acyl-carrier-protein]--phosphate acyltransferase; AltName: Full=Phosphate-acyl-ACP acyltransferase [Candidatus Ruthia magnifica str. Cm (Calyptogena magnifica)]ABL02240.1 phosphate:acyl-[acyl carrier protein] acyltransferase [Candidatus Ruthia magnifica str. Cm (Calyptogena magnifica)]
MTIKVSIDASGGDYGISVTIKAGIKALDVFQDLYLYFVGDESSIKAELNKHLSNTFSSRYTIIHASEVVLMNESPAIALRKKKDSSMRVAINLVKTLKVNACVSAGNTGALMAISRFVLRTIKGIDRPAIMGRMPTMIGHTHMLDLGANVDSKPEALIEFATMGSIAVKHIENIVSPTIGLLNIGEEDMKGSEKIKKTAELLKASNLNYVGFVEGDDIYKGTVNLIVCDGFEGNIALKASEGVVLMMGYYLKQAFTRNLLTKLVALIATPVLRDFKSSLNPGKYNGASLLGLQGIVVKSHGSANVDSFLAAITEAYVEAHAKISDKISLQISKELEHNE